VAFAGGEYQPGTLIGDALIAHELAHVVQQGGGSPSGGAQTKDASLGEDSRLEQDADRSAVGAVVSAWTGANKGLANIGANALPRLTSGLRLSRCSSKGKLLENFATKFKDAAELIRNSPDAMKLVNEADAAGVEFGGYAEDGPHKDTWPYTAGNTVYIPKARADKIAALNGFLFELNNALRRSKFAELDESAAKGAAGGLTAKTYAYKMVEQEVEGMLRLGGIWFEMRKSAPKGEDWSKHDAEFYQTEYQDFQAKRKTKDDIIKDVLKRTYTTGVDAGKTTEQYYEEAYNRLSGGH
jgi:hypothetical protein